jgi:response regulator RpfG family c-di-GMP phosphodiesterase
MRNATDSAAQSIHAAAPRRSTPRVLVVDDAPANVALLDQLLTREGYVVLGGAK